MFEPPSAASAWLQVEQLACERDERRLFSDLSFSVSAGDMLQIEGPNGVGKTSLMRVLAGLLPAVEGRLLWQGEPLEDQWSEFYQATLFLGHLAGIKPELTTLENLSWYAAQEGETDEALLEQALAQVGLQGYEDQPAHQLSAGQKRRVALARLLITHKPFWLLDEPFTALDKAAVAALEQRMVAHTRAGGAVVLISHHALEGLPGLKKLVLQASVEEGR